MKALCWSSDTETLREAVSKARDLVGGGDVLALALGPVAKDAEEFLKVGASRVLRLQGGLEAVSSGIFTKVVLDVAQKEKPDLLLLGGTKHAKEVAPRLAVKLNTGCIPNAQRVEIKGDHVEADHLVYSGNAVATETITSKPAVVTLAPKSVEVKPRPTPGKVEDLQATVPTPKVKLRKSQAAVHEKKRIEDARVVVSGGRGVKKKEDFALVEALAGAFEGGFLGVSRPIAADLKWKSEDHWVGLSGHKVKPAAYIACGISGQIQHLAGMRDSKVIVAINMNEEAPIFKVCDYGIVGDLYKVLPLLTEAVKRARGKA